jgi:hypothetical protein
VRRRENIERLGKDDMDSIDGNVKFMILQYPKQFDIVLGSIKNKLRRQTKLSRILNLALSISLPYN